jgi:putrescine aminotransferase
MSMPVESHFSGHPATEKYARHVNPTLMRLLNVLGYGRVFVRAQGVWLWDHAGRRYLDALAGFGSVNIGHNHPRLTARLKSFLQEDALQFSHISPSPAAGDLAEALTSTLPPPLEICLYSNSGSEAVEAAMKLARAATKRAGFIYMDGGYHGTGWGSLSVMSNPRFRKPLEPLLPGCMAAPFGNLDRLESELKKESIAAVLLEPIQAEGGVVLAPPQYLRQVKKLCEKFGALMILDEVQTGMGRTGSLFAFEAEGVIPDILVLGKGLSGGIAPLAVTVTSPTTYRKAYGTMDRFDLHSSTFGGNAFSCTAGLETLRIVQEECLPRASAREGQILLEGLRQRLANHPLVQEVRGRGLLIGIQLGLTEQVRLHQAAPALVSFLSRKIVGQWIALQLLEKGIICQPAAHRWDVLKIEPPLTIQPQEIPQLIQGIGDVFEDCRSLTKVVMAAGRRISRQTVLRP